MGTKNIILTLSLTASQLNNFSLLMKCILTCFLLEQSKGGKTRLCQTGMSANSFGVREQEWVGLIIDGARQALQTWIFGLNIRPQAVAWDTYKISGLQDPPRCMPIIRVGMHFKVLMSTFLLHWRVKLVYSHSHTHVPKQLSNCQGIRDHS